MLNRHSRGLPTASKVVGSWFVGIIAIGCMLMATAAFGASPRQKAMVEISKKLVPGGPWMEGDQKGMANTQGRGTWWRCSYHLGDPRAKVYEVSHLRTGTMSSSPFAAPLEYTFVPTKGVPFSRHAFNGETVKGETAGQGTQMDAIGHFGVLPDIWPMKGTIPYDKVTYYGGYTQKDVKPTTDSPLLKLGIENAPPIITTAVLLDAKAHLGQGQAMKAGAVITANDIKDMIKAQGLSWRGILPGDVVYIYTGWSENWADPDTKKVYYTRGPGLSFDAAKYLEEKKVVMVALDNPFTDPAAEGMIFGKAPPAKGTPPGLPFVVHHYNLTVAGIHQIQNANLAAMAKDKVWTSCTIILALRVKGGAGSAVRPVAIGAPNQ